MCGGHSLEEARTQSIKEGGGQIDGVAGAGSQVWEQRRHRVHRSCPLQHFDETYEVVAAPNTILVFREDRRHLRYACGRSWRSYSLERLS